MALPPSQPPAVPSPSLPATNYTTWDTPSLISRIQSLEASLAQVQSLVPAAKPLRRVKPPPREFEPSRYQTRLIALKFAYIGQPYNGYEYHGNDTELPTVEEVLFSALLKSRLVAAIPGHPNPELPEAWPGDEAAQYSKCGRTDRGVSAFGQVVGVRVRSRRPPPKTAMDADGEEKPWDDITDEMPYTQILNRLLPPTIRVLAWAPNPPADFSARFNCRARHYRYFFTNPMLAPTNPSATLDIGAMQKAAAYYLGDHDFRNFCKIDASKQIENFVRTIMHSSIEQLHPGDTTGVATYYFDLRGSAFLWHQVRHMMAILFLVGQGYEKPEIVRDMLDMTNFPTKPMYEMAEDRPLVLWDCVFPNDDLRWIVSDEGDLRGALADTTWRSWHEKKIDEILAGQLVGLVEHHLKTSTKEKILVNPAAVKKRKKAKEGHVLILGSGEAVARGKYIPMGERRRMRPVAEINASYFERKGDWRERRELKRKQSEAEVGEGM